VLNSLASGTRNIALYSEVGKKKNSVISVHLTAVCVNSVPTVGRTEQVSMLVSRSVSKSKAIPVTGRGGL
jgi:hypothetical protein